MTELYRPHRCALSYPDRAGILVRCDGCGRLWRSVCPGNPAYAGWRRIGPAYRLLFGKRLRSAGLTPGNPPPDTA